jgi:hypothetical protein
MIHSTQPHTNQRRKMSFGACDRITLVLLLFCLMFVSVASAQDTAYVLSNRVGNTIDQSEREYFGLFPAVKGFDSAKFFELPQGQVRLVISRRTDEGMNDSTRILNEDVVTELRVFIENFEEVIHGKKQIRWYLLTNLVHVSFFTSKEGVEMAVTTRRGRQYGGILLSATDSLLVLWQSTDPYDWRAADSLVKTARLSEIGQIIVKEGGGFWSGVGYGALIGGGTGVILGLASGSDKGGWIQLSAGAKALIAGVGLGIPSAIIGGISGAIKGTEETFDVKGNADAYKKLLPALKEKAVLSSQPPELSTLAGRPAEEPPEPPVQQAGQPAVAPSEPARTRFHLSVGFGWVTTGANDNIVKAFNASGFGGTSGGFFGPITYPINVSSKFSWNIGAAYSITDRLRLGLDWEKLPQQEVTGKDYELEHANATFVNLYAEFVVAPVDPLLISRFEFAIGAGVSYSRLSVSSHISALFGAAYGENPSIVEVNKTVPGVNLRASLDYYISRHVSLQGRIGGRIIKAVDVPSVTHVNPYDSSTKTLAAHSVNFSGMDYSLCVRLHF